MGAAVVYCEIRVKGHLASRWSEWFGGLEIEAQPNGEAVLAGVLPDQAALYGVLDRLRDLGVALISLRCDEMARCGCGAPSCTLHSDGTGMEPSPVRPADGNQRGRGKERALDPKSR